MREIKEFFRLEWVQGFIVGALLVVAMALGGSSEEIRREAAGDVEGLRGSRVVWTAEAQRAQSDKEGEEANLIASPPNVLIGGPVPVALDSRFSLRLIRPVAETACGNDEL